MNRPLSNDFGNRIGSLTGRVIAILATDGVEFDELSRAKRELLLAGARAIVIGPKPGKIRGFREPSPAGEHSVDVALDATSVSEFDGLLVPGGVLHVDALRCMPRVIEFVRSFVLSGLPVAVSGHAASLLIDAGVVRGRKLSAWPSLKTDLTNAGARWMDRDVVSERSLLSGRAVPAYYTALRQHMAQAASAESPLFPDFLARLFSPGFPRAHDVRARGNASG